MQCNAVIQPPVVTANRSYWLAVAVSSALVSPMDVAGVSISPFQSLFRLWHVPMRENHARIGTMAIRRLSHTTDVRYICMLGSIYAAVTKSLQTHHDGIESECL